MIHWPLLTFIYISDFFLCFIDLVRLVRIILIGKNDDCFPFLLLRYFVL